MKTKLIAVMLVAGASAFAQNQFGQDYNGGPDYNSAQGNPGYDDPAYNNGAPGYNEPQNYGGAPQYYSQAPAVGYAAQPLCAPGTVWIDAYDGVNGYCAVPPYSGAFWIGPRYFGGRFIAGYWGGRRGFAAGRGFRGGSNFGRNNFRGGAVGGRSFNGNNFRRGAVGGQTFGGNNNRGGAFSGGSNFRGGGAPSGGRSSGGFSRGGGGGRSSGGGHSGHR